MGEGMGKPTSLDRRLGAILRSILLWPVAGILVVAGIRFALISNPGRIGHMAAEIDCFLKERELGLIPPVRPILLADRKRTGFQLRTRGRSQERNERGIIENLPTRRALAGPRANLRQQRKLVLPPLPAHAARATRTSRSGRRAQPPPTGRPHG